MGGTLYYLLLLNVVDAKCDFNLEWACSAKNWKDKDALCFIKDDDDLYVNLNIDDLLAAVKACLLNVELVANMQNGLNIVLSEYI